MSPDNEKLLKKLEGGDIVWGSHIFGGLPILTEAMAQCGFDVLWIDMEHTGIGRESVVNNLIAARAGGTPAWVRVPWNDPVLVKPIVDMGADGIIFPYVRTAEEAKLAVASCTYPPNGIRGYGPLRALNYGAITQHDFVHTYYRKCRRVIQLEHIEAIRNLPEIADVEGIDAFIVGPNDLSASIGRIGEVRHPELLALYREIADILREKKKVFGVSMGYNEEVIRDWLSLGARIIFTGNDVGYVYEGASAVRKGYDRIAESEQK